MSNRKRVKSIIAIILVITSLVTVFAPAVSAEEPAPSIPDLSEYSFITIDEIEPETTVSDLIQNTVLSETEEIEIYDWAGYLLSCGDYVGNGATIVISDNEAVTEVYKVRLYGDLDCNGRINAADSVDLKRSLLNLSTPFDDTVADATADGALNVSDLVRLKKNQADTAKIPQNRMHAYSARFNWLDSSEVPYAINGFEEVFEDFSVVSNDIDLTFNRYYDSNNTESGILGEGWTAAFEGSCQNYGDNSKIVKIYGQTPVAFKLTDDEYSCDYSRATLTATDNGFVFIGEDGLTYTFGQDGYLVSIKDKNNNTVSVTADTNGKIQKITDSVGREYSYTYGENGLLEAITDCIGRTVSYTYDSLNRLTSVTGVLGTVTEQYSYNGNNKLIKVSDPFGNIISAVAYENNSGIVSSVTDSENAVTDYIYNADNNSVTLLQDDTVTEKYVYNRYNYLTSSNTDEGLQQNFYCNAYGDISVTENADESKTLYSYDTAGNPVTIATTAEEETVTEINGYDPNGNVIYSSTDNEATVYTYDDNGNTLSVTKTVDGEQTESTEYTYTDNGLVHSSATDNVTTTYSYDNYGYLTGEADTEGNTKAYSYNTVGWLESEADSENTVSYKYNLNGDTLRKTENNIVTSRTVYDNYGRVKQQISEAEYNSDFDGLDLSPQTDSYLNNSQEVSAGVRYCYGDDGKLSQIKASCYTVATDGNQKVTSVTAGNTVLAEYNYTEDAKELLSGVEYANGQSISYSYDTEGNITSLYYGDTLAYSYTYDEEGTLTSKVNLLENIRTDYTEDNITVSEIAEDGTSTEIYSYKSEMLIKAELPVGVLSDDMFFPADSDEEADLERITESFGGQSFYTDYYENLVKYDTVAYRTTKNENEAISETTLKNNYTNILSSEYSYNEDSLPSELTNTFGGYENSYSYTYDGNGNITAITENFGYKLGENQLPIVSADGEDINSTSYNKKYFYDNSNQLIRVDDEESNSTVVYEYEGLSGNIKSVTCYPYTTDSVISAVPDSTVIYSYTDSDWSDLLTSYNGNTLTYDSLGNLLTYNGYTYTWEAGRRLVHMSNGTNTYSYKYDDNGIRTQKTVNGVTTHYTTVDGRITGQYDGTNIIYFRYNADNSLIGFNLNSTEYIYLKNIQGDIEGILDPNGNLVVEYTYDAWGKVLSVTGSMADTVGTINPMRHRDYYLDSETGYYYLQSRYYNPEFCRFINADEPSVMLLNLDSEVGANLFAYCNNNPVNYSDPTGHVVTPANIIGAVIGFVIGIVGGYFLSRFLADKLGLKGWKRTFFIVGVSAVITATATAIGYFIGPYIGKAYRALINGLRGLFKPKFGTQIGRLGTLTHNTKPAIKGLTKHGLQRMAQRGVSKSLAQKIVRNGYAIAQKGGKVLYFTKEGVVVLSASGQVVTAYTSAYFDEAMQAIVSLFYK